VLGIQKIITKVIKGVIHQENKIILHMQLSNYIALKIHKVKTEEITGNIPNSSSYLDFEHTSFKSDGKGKKLSL
jgi:hypothetical protein